ncbi:AMP-binding protein [Alteromonas lipolytica]|uniref:AMP-dependent synthetase n=1 Tax=Alteromonas lipolytica TaxID=1856405 RepID=A0A1E8FH03_9ALTE|nr:AMP-binding protein [Alteromonas lipolytica]OFI34878.1 AMP-dependent synthetase [Alteromonas lipolytica]GGF54774.1 AMP-dependent synthetase [Alteromonas lipolytica]
MPDATSSQSQNSAMSLLECFYYREQHTPDQPFLIQPVAGEYQTYNWREVATQARKLAWRLTNMAFEPGSRIAILSKNCAEWVITDLAIMLAGHVSVPIFATAGTDTIRYVLAHADVRLVFVGKLDEAEKQLSAIDEKITTVAFPYPGLKTTYSWTEFCHCEAMTTSRLPAADELMTIIYTSGSTGNPKGVMHSYGAMAWAGAQGKHDLGLDDTDRLLSYLPLAHITERVLIEMAALQSGMTLYFIESLDTFQRDVQHCQPTLFVSVPRLWTKFQLGILHKLPQAKLNILLKIPLVSSLIKRKIRHGLGLAQTKLCASGSAPLPPVITAWFEKLGIEICEGWGMTENAALGTACLPFRKDKIGCIGVPWGNVTLKLSEQQELLTKSPGNMQGYYQDPQRTAEALTADGFLRTGDKAIVDADGYYTITGRIKDIFKTAKGKYVTPAPIEAMLMENTFIEQVCVTGASLAQPVALLVLSEEAQEHSRSHITHALQRTLEKVNGQLESHQRLDHMVILAEPWTIENDLLTPTLKVKRHVLEERFPDVIHQAYTDKVIWQHHSV